MCHEDFVEAVCAIALTLRSMFLQIKMVEAAYLLLLMESFIDFPIKTRLQSAIACDVESLDATKEVSYSQVTTKSFAHLAYFPTISLTKLLIQTGGTVACKIGFVPRPSTKNCEHRPPRPFLLIML